MAGIAEAGCRWRHAGRVGTQSKHQAVRRASKEVGVFCCLLLLLGTAGGHGEARGGLSQLSPRRGQLAPHTDATEFHETRENGVGGPVDVIPAVGQATLTRREHSGNQDKVRLLVMSAVFLSTQKATAYRVGK